MESKSPSMVFLIRALDIGGAQRQLVELASGLHHCGWNVTVATFYPGGPLAEGLMNAGVRLVSLDKAGRTDTVSFGWRLIRFMRSESPDIVHGYLDVSNLLLTLMRPFLPNTRVVWGMRASNMELARYDWLWRIVYRVTVWLSRFPDLIICNSAAGRAYHLAQGCCGTRMIVIHNGIDLERFRPQPELRREVRNEWGLAGSHRVVGIVARLDPMKDHATFLRAAARVMDAESEVRFVCVGDGPPEYRQMLHTLAGSLGLRDAIVWAGPRDDMHRIYNALDLLVCSSAFGEGFPNVVAEAMATGVPCVVTDVGDAAEVVAEWGRVCPPRDPVALSEAILTSLRAAPPPEALREAIRTRYSAAVLCERTAGELRPLVSPAAPRPQPRARTDP